MHLPQLIALAFLVVTVTGFSAHTQTPDLECARLSSVPDDGVPLAVGLKALASKEIDPSQAESACRSALSRLLKKRCNDTSPLSDWKCRALCLPIWSTLAQSAGYSDQSGQLDEIVGRHRQGELEVEFPNAT